MKKASKIWVGVGAFVVVGAGTATAIDAAQALSADAASVQSQLVRATNRAAAPVSRAGGMTLAAMSHGDEAGESGEPVAKSGAQGGEEGGAPSAAKLPPDLSFALKIAELRGHLLIGNQLVTDGQWTAAMPHFLHPTEEIYGEIRGDLKAYKVPPFEVALKVLANAVKTKKGGDIYVNALKTVNDALAAADVGLKAKQPDWASFTVETAVELAKAAAGEYEEAIVDGRISKPVEYQDARGFIWQAEAMIESVSPALDKKDAAALKSLRAAFANLKNAFPTAMPPHKPIVDYGGVLSDVSRVELAAGRLM